MPERAEVGVKRCPKKVPVSSGQVDHNPNIFCKMPFAPAWDNNKCHFPPSGPVEPHAAQFHLEIEVASDNAKFGFVEFAEKWNGRMAMLGFTIGLATEAVTGSGILKQLGL
eukprot:g43264.t1